MKIAIITGGSNGIGKSTALELGKRGIGVILTYNSYKERAAEVVKEIEKNPGARAVALKLDLTRRETFADFEREVQKNLKEFWDRSTFDYLVNNGGVGGPMMFDEMTEEYFDRILNTNFKGAVFLSKHLVAFMNDGGAIVNTSSSSKTQSFPGYSIYGSLKRPCRSGRATSRRNSRRAGFASTRFRPDPRIPISATALLINTRSSSSPWSIKPPSPDSARPRIWARSSRTCCPTISDG